MKERTLSRLTRGSALATVEFSLAVHRRQVEWRTGWDNWRGTLAAEWRTQHWPTHRRARLDGLTHSNVFHWLQSSVHSSNMNTFSKYIHTRMKGRKGKDLYSAFKYARIPTKRSDTHHTTPCLPFLHKCSPDGATTTEAADIQLQLTTHLSTPKGWKAELAWLVDL